MPARESAVRIVVLAHDLLGTYGDLGNGLVLAARLRWRGQPAELVVHEGGTAVPAAGDIYLLGGGEDAPQFTALHALRTSGALNQAADAGSVVLAVCAGFQLIGTSLVDADGGSLPGLGLVDAIT